VLIFWLVVWFVVRVRGAISSVYDCFAALSDLTLWLRVTIVGSVSPTGFIIPFSIFERMKSMAKS
jgi:hypothetical protein